MALKLRRLSYALGAEVCDIDVSKPMGEAQFGEIYRAFLQYGILLFRNQDITREEHIDFSRRFGELDRHDSLPRDRRADHPELLMVTNEPNADGTPSDTRYTGRQWHSDMSFTTVPSLGSLLRCFAVPEVGGDTLFANMDAAYDALSDGMKKLIAGLHGIQLSGTRKIANEESGVVRAAEQRRLNPPVAQPIVRVHPETGRKALYIGEKVKRFDGMTEEESKPLIDYLVRHATRPDFVYRHQWRKDDILAWDNRCTMHQALGDFDETQLRHMERTTILGTPSGYVVANG
ncbi:MAG: TauD/TfdA family dioxygenase [Betaproteobacteria bacterium]|nr:TauD/TfdA family dioxygenase [Betaproteobacteria bacterium]